MTHQERESWLLDTHFHLDLCPNPVKMVQEIEAAKVYTVAVTNTPAVFPQTLSLARKTKYVRAAIGLHPQLALERESDLPLFRRYLSQTRYVGEVGLDYVTSVKSERRVQRRVFDSILGDCHASGGKILTIHSRRAAADVVEAIGDSFPGAWILHWYSGSRRVLQRAVVAGAHFSVNAAMVESARSEALIREVPLNRILTESDGPLISIDGVVATPMMLGGVVQHLASWWGLGIAETNSQLRENARQLLE